MLFRSGVLAAARPSLTLYIRPAAHGAGTGVDWANAASLSSLPALFAQCGGNSAIYLRADEGAYTIDSGLNTLTLDGGGDSGRPITIKGVAADLSDMNVQMQGTRDAPQNGVYLYRTDFNTSGFDLFSLADGLHDVTISHFDIQNMGCVFLPQGSAARLAFTDMSVTNSYSFFSSETDNLGTPITSDQFTNNDLTFQRITSNGFSLGFIRIAQTYQNLLIEDCYGDSQQQQDTAFCIVFHISGTTVPSMNADWLAANPGGGAIFRRCTAKNAYYHSTAGDLSGVYWNSDGFCDERTVTGSLYEDCLSTGNTDGGWDCKSTNLHLVRCTASANKIDFKIWGSATLDDCSSSDPFKLGGTGAPAHLSFFGGSDILCTLNNFSATGSVGNAAAFMTLQSSAIGASTLNVSGYSISLQPGTTFIGTPTAPGTITTNFSPALPTINLGVNYRAGYDAGRIPNGTAAGTIVADLAVTGTGAGGAILELIADANSGFQIVGTTLQLKNTLDVTLFTYQSFTVRATTSDGIAAATASGLFYVDSPTPNFSCDWNGTNGATTATDDGAGATITFTGCSLTTTSPIEGSASLLLSGGSTRAVVPDSNDWIFDGMFSLKAKVNLTSLAAASVILAHWNSSGNQRAWALQVSTAGALQLVYSSTGNATTTIASADGLITTGQTYEAAADRDFNGAVRLYLNGVMVAKSTTAAAFKNSTAGLTIGNTANGASATVGRIDRTKVWRGWPFCANDAGYTVI